MVKKLKILSDSLRITPPNSEIKVKVVWRDLFKKRKKERNSRNCWNEDALLAFSIVLG